MTPTMSIGKEKKKPQPRIVLVGNDAADADRCIKVCGALPTKAVGYAKSSAMRKLREVDARRETRDGQG